MQIRFLIFFFFSFNSTAVLAVNADSLKHLAEEHSQKSSFDASAHFYLLAAGAYSGQHDSLSSGDMFFNAALAFDQNGQSDEAIKGYSKALQYYTDPVYRAETLLFRATVLYEANRIEECLQDAASALGYLQSDEYPELHCRILNMLALCKEHQADYKKAWDFYTQSLQYAQEKPLMQSAVLNNMAGIMQESGNYKSAAELYLKSLELKSPNKKTEESSLFTLANLGQVYELAGDYTQAFSYERKALHLADSLGYTAVKLVSLDNLGRLFRKNKKYDSAAMVFRKALKYSRMYQDTNSYAISLLNYAILLDEAFPSDSAEIKMNEAYQLLKKSGDIRNQAAALNSLAGIYLQQQDFEKSEKMVLEGMEIASKAGMGQISLDLYDQLASIYSLKENTALALKWSNKARKLSDSLLNAKKIRQLVSLEMNYQYEKEVSRLLAYADKQKAVVQLKLDNSRKNLNIIIIALIVSFILSVVLFRQLQKKRRAYQMLVRKNKQLLNLHENLKNPQQKNRQHQKPKYQNSALDEDAEEELLQKLEQCLSEKQLFLQSGLKAAFLSELLETKPAYISQVINKRCEMNFNTYINSWRIRHALKLIRQGRGKTLNLDGLALECGFSNRITFYNAFKKHTGLSPSYYIREEGKL